MIYIKIIFNVLGLLLTAGTTLWAIFWGITNISKEPIILLLCPIVLLLLGSLVYNSYMCVYIIFDHYGWKENARPNKKAKIQSISSEKVKYSKNDAKLKTTIIFSDGFYFITYKTERKNGVGMCRNGLFEVNSAFLYTIFISDKLKKDIINLAIQKHSKAIVKYFNDK